MRRELITCDRCGTEIRCDLVHQETHYEITTRCANAYCVQKILEGLDLCGSCHAELAKWVKGMES